MSVYTSIEEPLDEGDKKAQETPNDKQIDFGETHASPLQDSITIVELIYHQRLTQQPTQLEYRFNRFLASKEQPYSRQRTVGEEWQKLDMGWFSEEDAMPGMIVVSNDEGTFLQVRPTDEEKIETSRKILEVAFACAMPTLGSPFWLVFPGTDFRGWPAEHSLFIRCRSGEAKYTVNVFPG